MDIIPRYSRVISGDRLTLTLEDSIHLVFRHPAEQRELPLPRPDLVESESVVDHPTLQDVADLVGVLDVVERIGVEHQEIGQLADLEGPDVPIEPDAFGPEQG